MDGGLIGRKERYFSLHLDFPIEFYYNTINKNLTTSRERATAPFIWRKVVPSRLLLHFHIKRDEPVTRKTKR